MLSVILSDAKPVFLRLATRVFNARGYIPVFKSTTSWSMSLETLELRINISKEQFDFQECFRHITHVLSTLSVRSLRLELRCSNIEHLDEHTDDEVDNSGQKCDPYLEDGYRWYCYTENALLREDLLQRVRDCMQSGPTLRRMTLIWARCEAPRPTRVIGVDLDNPPYSWDRPGNDSDGEYRVGYFW
ncbi:hypothetical protein K466DRAFT_600694 [Polyporus arcularius HHB13444]|uniref:Uncharacterized protein n=1 Tax=Polyporus arcularius HHB13444 TaxID=1314778 RepID=A0A5C3PJ61_9APHY|nr:hypothetical protein K466DRAFT_600694 [Polyporus arcularius HHB13444]